MLEGNPLPSPAPGVVDSVGEDEGGRYIFIRHTSSFRTSCGHISKTLVGKGDHVSRGQIIALSGKSGRNTEAANYPHNHFQLLYRDTIALDPYRPEFDVTPQYSGYYDFSLGKFVNGSYEIPWVSVPITSNPNLLNYWTKDEDPQYA